MKALFEVVKEQGSPPVVNGTQVKRRRNKWAFGMGKEPSQKWSRIDLKHTNVRYRLSECLVRGKTLLAVVDRVGVCSDARQVKRPELLEF